MTDSGLPARVATIVALCGFEVDVSDAAEWSSAEERRHAISLLDLRVERTTVCAADQMTTPNVIRSVRGSSLFASSNRRRQMSTVELQLALAMSAATAATVTVQPTSEVDIVIVTRISALPDVELSAPRTVEPRVSR